MTTNADEVHCGGQVFTVCVAGLLREARLRIEDLENPRGRAYPTHSPAARVMGQLVDVVEELQRQLNDKQKEESMLAREVYGRCSNVVGLEHLRIYTYRDSSAHKIIVNGCECGSCVHGTNLELQTLVDMAVAVYERAYLDGRNSIKQGFKELME